MDGEFDPDLVQDLDDETLIRFLRESGPSLVHFHVALTENELRDRRLSDVPVGKT